VLCQLDGKRADPAGTGVDQDFLSLLQLGAFDQYLPRGQAHQGNGGGLFHGEILGLQRYVGFIHGDEFRERPDPVLVWPCIHLVARLEPSDLGPDTDHDPGHVVAQDQRQAIGQDELELTIPDLGIQLVQTGRVDGDQDIMVANFRFRHFAGAQCAVALVTIDDECLHDCFSGWMATGGGTMARAAMH